MELIKRLIGLAALQETLLLQVSDMQNTILYRRFLKVKRPLFRNRMHAVTIRAKIRKKLVAAYKQIHPKN